MGLLLLMGGVSDPNPQSLFVNNELGLAIDIGDRNGASQAKIDSGLTGATFKTAYPNHSLYQDANGVTPAIQPGDQVGLVIDSSKGGLGAIGSELVTNGGFDTDTVWTKGADWSIGSGVATMVAGAGTSISQNIAITPGRLYRVRFTVTAGSNITVRIRLGGTTNLVNASLIAGSYEYFLFAESSNLAIAFLGSTLSAYSIDNVSCREVPGIHPYQTTSGSRPALCRTPDGGRRNLLTYSEDLSNAAWGKTSVTVTGTDTIVLSAGSAGKYVSQTITGTAPSTISFEAKEGTHRYIQVLSSSDAQHFVNIDLQTGTIGTTGSKAEGALIESLSGGWNKYRVTITNTGFSSIRFYAVDSSSAVYGASTSATTSWQMRKVQLETGSSATTYQKVTTTHDVTEASRRDCWGLMADGSDDSLITTSVDFSGTDKMTVMAGVRKNSDANRGMIVELSANAGLNAGTFSLSGPDFTPGTNKYAIYGRASGSILSLMDTAAGRTAPVTNVLSMTNDLSLSNAEHSLRINGALVGSTSGDSGSGNFGNYALFIGRRNNTDTPFAGIIYTLIIRGAATPTSTIADFEKNLLRLRAGLGPF